MNVNFDLNEGGFVADDGKVYDEVTYDFNTGRLHGRDTRAELRLKYALLTWSVFIVGVGFGFYLSAVTR